MTTIEIIGWVLLAGFALIIPWMLYGHFKYKDK
jgi:hypothetical protein